MVGRVCCWPRRETEQAACQARPPDGPHQKNILQGQLFSHEPKTAPLAPPSIRAEKYAPVRTGAHRCTPVHTNAGDASKGQTCRWGRRGCPVLGAALAAAQLPLQDGPRCPSETGRGLRGGAAPAYKQQGDGRRCPSLRPLGVHPDRRGSSLPSHDRRSRGRCWPLHRWALHRGRLR